MLCFDLPILNARGLGWGWAGRNTVSRCNRVFILPILHRLQHAVAWLVIAWLGMLPAAPLQAADAIRKLEAAEFIIADTPAPPTADADWQSVALTDRWSLVRYQQGSNGWYRLRVTLATPPEEPWGIYLPRFNMNSAIFLNGQLLGSGGRFPDPIARNWNRPLLARAPAALWRQGGNTLHIRLKSYPGHGYLAPVYVGPLAALTPEYDFRRLLQVDISQALLPITLFIGVFVFFLWVKRRHDSQYLWFSLAVLAWSHYSTNMIVVDIPMPSYLWEILAYASVDWFAVFLAIFGLRFTGHPFGRVDKAFLLFAAAATLAYALADQASIKAVARIWHTGAITIGGYAVFAMLRSWRRTGTLSHAAMAAGLAIILLTAMHDWMFQFGYIGMTERTGFHLLHYSAPVIFTLMAWHLVRRFTHALNEAETLNRELEQRIEKKRQSLEKYYATIQEMEKREVVLEERERLSREIHDGMSGNLANAIMLSEIIDRELRDAPDATLRKRLQQMKEQLNNGLLEMRNLILAMEGDVATVGELVNHLNDKCERLLVNANIDFQLHDETRNENHPLSQQQSLNILRILQEAANNVIKHARASTVVLRIFDHEEGIGFQLIDDGDGFDPDAVQTGHGLKNMRKRAKEIDARLTIASSPGNGSRLSLTLDSRPE
ncbi:MAG TPA: hypothetical protein ENI94_14485 [Gammaproteobacteria bacterium]|nr:hypothetical protein [Gammaproteobacteria bacterium]